MKTETPEKRLNQWVNSLEISSDKLSVSIAYGLVRLPTWVQVRLRGCSIEPEPRGCSGMFYAGEFCMN